MLRVPVGLARDRLEHERVDLGQRVVAREVPEGVREVRVAARVVERVTRLVQECLVVVQPSLGPGDQVDDVRRVGRDDAGARGLLRPVVEVELDALSFARSKPSCESVPRQTSTERSFVYVDSSGESRRRYDMWYEVGISSRSLPSSSSNQRSRSDEKAEAVSSLARRAARRGRARDSLLFFVPLDRIGECPRARPRENPRREGGRRASR